MHLASFLSEDRGAPWIWGLVRLMNSEQVCSLAPPRGFSPEPRARWHVCEAADSLPLWVSSVHASLGSPLPTRLRGGVFPWLLALAAGKASSPPTPRSLFLSLPPQPPLRLPFLCQDSSSFAPCRPPVPRVVTRTFCNNLAFPHLIICVECQARVAESGGVEGATCAQGQARVFACGRVGVRPAAVELGGGLCLSPPGRAQG